MFPSNKATVYKEFFWSMVAVFAINTIQNLGTNLWPFAFMLLFVLVGAGKHGRVDLTTTNTLARIFVEGDDWNVIDLCWTCGVQFGGALLGSIIYGAVTDSAARIHFAPGGNPDDRWRPFLCFMFFHGIYYQVVAAYGKTKTNSLERNLGLAFAYASVACAIQVFAPGAWGGFNIDAGRLLGSKMIHDSKAGNDLKDYWWIAFFGPFAGVAQAKLFIFIEGLVACDGASEEAPKEAAAVEEA